MNLDTALTNHIEENWNSIRKAIHQQWPQLTQADVNMTDGDSRKLVALVHQKTGLRLNEIERHMDQIAAHSAGLQDRVAQPVTESVTETASAAYREIKNSVVNDAAKSVGVTFGTGVLIGFCATALLGRRSI